MLRGYHWLAFVVTGLLAFHLLACGYGIVTQHYPVPIWDLWRSGVGITDAVQAGGWSYFTEIHNQHWIVWTKLLLLIDEIKPWRGMGFLLAVNFLLLTILVGTTFCITGRLVDRAGKRVLLVVTLLGGFSLTQYENLYWGFQGQFFLIYIFALGSFFLFSLSVARPAKRVYFWGACCLALFSALSMGNGMAVFPGLVVFGLLVRLGWKRMAVLLILGGFLWSIYLSTHGAYAGSTMERGSSAPSAYLLYLLGFFGNPLYRAMPGIQPVGAYIAGGVFLLLAVWYFLRTLDSPPSAGRTEKLGVVFFVGFLVVSAALAAWSRVPSLGVEQSFNSRYATPALLGWITLGALFISGWSGRASTYRWLLPALVAVCLVPYQRTGFADKRGFNHYLETAVLALSMEVYDPQRVLLIAPASHRDARFMELTRSPRMNRRGVFGQYPFSAAIGSMGQRVTAAGEGRYDWHVDSLTPVEGASGVFFLQGWIVDREKNRVPRGVYLLDEAETVIGFAVTGNPRTDVADFFSTPGFAGAGFRGYLRADSLDQWVAVAEPARRDPVAIKAAVSGAACFSRSHWGAMGFVKLPYARSAPEGCRSSLPETGSD